MGIIIEALKAGYKSIKIQAYKDGTLSAYLEAKDSHMPDLEIYADSIEELHAKILDSIQNKK